MKHVIIGAGVAGTEAAKTIRGLDENAGILLISADTQIHSRCMLHKFIGGERDEKSLNFTEDDFFEKYRVDWKKGVRVVEVCPGEKEIHLDTGEKVGYDRLLIANGADSCIPPVGDLRKASNV